MKTAFSEPMLGGSRSPPCCSVSMKPEAAISGNYLWEFMDPVSDGATGYARFRFSYASRLPESIGRAVLFEGISCFRFHGELISHYSEAFDRGVALAQLAFPAERIKRILEKAATSQNQLPEARRHLDRFSPG
jgi:hypothetical protein